MKKTVLILLVLILSACGSTAISVSTPVQTPIVPTATPVPAQSNYKNPKYGYSLSYPDIYSVVTVNDEYVEIGDKIVISVWDTDPTVPLGDGAFVESTTDTQLSGYSAKLLKGYIGSVGGYIPQQFERFVVERNGSYFVFTLYALGLHVTEGDVSQIAQLDPEDITLFDSIMASVQIP